MTFSFRRAALAGSVLLALNTIPVAAAAEFGLAIAPTQAQVWVAGRQIEFTHLAIAYGDPVAPADDPGLAAMLGAVAAKSSWQPGTRFVVFTRADGALITFTLGSNAVSVDGATTDLPFAPFTAGSSFEVPLLPLARALQLGVRGFRGGYVFVPQVTSVAARAETGRTVVRVTGSAPLAWRSAFAANASARTLTLSFAGFGTDAAGTTPVAGADATSFSVTQDGPPGYPTTHVAIAIARGSRFIARRIGSGVTVDIVIARSDAALQSLRAGSTPPSVRVAASQAQSPAPTPRPTLAPTPTPTPMPTISPPPANEPLEVATAEPLGPEPMATESQSPGPSSAPGPTPTPPIVKISDVSVAESATGTRITLTLSGPVSFEWHRLADPDDRYWLDIAHAQLVGPARTLPSRLTFIKEIKISQHLLVPDPVVRLSIAPTQAVDVVVGGVVGASDQLGIEIETNPPAAAAPTSGAGSIGLAVAAASPSPMGSGVPSTGTDQGLIVIDPGHGGTDPGSLNPAYGLVESKLTLAISERLADDLKHEGWRVTMTRDGDYDVGDPARPDNEELQARCDVANAAGARLFISVHINSSVSSAPNGTTTFYWHPQDRDFAQTVQNDIVNADGIADGGVKRVSFYVIHHTVMPSLLVEAAYLSNDHDAQLLTQQSFLDKVAAGISRGIDDFTGGPPPPIGQTRQPHQ